MNAPTLSREVPAIDEPYDRHAAYTEHLGGSLGTDQGVGWERNGLWARFQHIDEA